MGRDFARSLYRKGSGSYRKERHAGRPVRPDELDAKDCGKFAVAIDIETERKAEKQYRALMALSCIFRFLRIPKPPARPFMLLP